jgi:hypothetical protein
LVSQLLFFLQPRKLTISTLIIERAIETERNGTTVRISRENKILFKCFGILSAYPQKVSLISGKSQRKQSLYTEIALMDIPVTFNFSQI